MQAGAVLAELKRRRVIRALVGYGIAAFAVLQIIEPVMHGLRWPEAVLSYVVVALAAGFPVVVALAWIFDVKAGRIERTAPVQPLRGRLALVLVAIGLLAAAPGLLFYFVVRRPRPDRTAAPTAPSIAVLPFVNLSSDKEQEYFSDGIAEEILYLLAKVPGLHVAARTSAFSFKGKSVKVDEIGRELGVASVLEGSVRKAGDRVRITTDLINAADGYHVWSETYDRKLTDIFTVQDDIGQAVVTALRLKLLPVEVPTSKDHRTSDPDAYLQYLLGRQLLSRNDRDAYLQSRQAFQKAIALDPGFAPAWAGLARAEYWIADSGETLREVSEGQQLARRAAEKSVAIGPEAPEGYVARGFIRAQVEFDWTGAQSDFERALAVSPEDADLIREYIASVLRPLGRGEQMVTFARKAVELDPLNSASWTMLGACLFRTGQLEPAREALEHSMQLNPQQAFAPGFLGVISILKGQAASALPVLEKSTSEVFRLTGKAMAYHSLGRAEDSNVALEALIAKHSHDAAYQIANVHAWRGEIDSALHWLERARLQRDGGLTTLKLDPLMRSLRGDRRYAAFLRRMNLPLD